MMDRRTLISAIALATVCARSGAFAQQQRSWRVGFVALPERPEPLEGSRFGAFGRPGHNITGVSILSADLSGKLVEMLQSVAPTATRVAILLNPRNSSNAAIAINLQVAMQGARVTGQPVEAATAEGIEQAFARMQRQ